MIKGSISGIDSAMTASEVMESNIASDPGQDTTVDLTFRLRAVEPEDVDFMHEVENDMEAWIYGDTVAPLSREQLAAYAMTYTADPSLDGQLRLIIEKESCHDTENILRNMERHGQSIKHEPVGIVDLYDINQRHGHGFIGIYIKPSARRSGAGKEGVRQMARLARRFLNLDVICAKIVDINESSLRFFKSCGFRICGVIPAWLKIEGERHDLHLLELDLNSSQGHGAR